MTGMSSLDVNFVSFIFLSCFRLCLEPGFYGGKKKNENLGEFVFFHLDNKKCKGKNVLEMKEKSI